MQVWVRAGVKIRVITKFRTGIRFTVSVMGRFGPGWGFKTGTTVGIMGKGWVRVRLGSTHKHWGPSSVTRQSPLSQLKEPGTLRVQLLMQKRLFCTHWG